MAKHRSERGWRRVQAGVDLREAIADRPLGALFVVVAIAVAIVAIASAIGH